MMQKGFFKAFLFTQAILISSAWGFDQTHSDYNAVVSKFVKDGVVNYEGMAGSLPELEKYLASIANIPSAEFKAMTQDQRLSILLNTYNAYTLQVILDHYPQLTTNMETRKKDKKPAFRSIRYVGPLMKGTDSGFKITVAPARFKQWLVSKYEVQKDGKTIQRELKIAGKVMSLDELENKEVRPLKEFRVHFALVCAALSCPYLRNEAYVPAKLSDQLNDQAKLFFGSSFRNRWDADKKQYRISKIVNDFYPKDFKEKAGSVWKAIKEYIPADTLAQIEKAVPAGTEPKLEDLTYHWVLNDQKCVSTTDCSDDQFKGEE